MVELTNGANDNGLSLLLAGLLEQNLVDHPERTRVLERMFGSVAIVAEDAQVATTLEFRKGSVRIHDGVHGVPDVTLRGGFEQIGDMSRMESLGSIPFPDPRGPVNRAMMRALWSRSLKVFGRPRALRLLFQMGEVLSVS